MGDESIRKIALLATIWAGWAWGQTAVDLRTQSKDIDFGAASSTRPFVTGATLPASCAVGEIFYATNAAAGANLYGCTSTNVWTLESGGGGGGGASSASQLTDFRAVRNTSTNLLIGSSCSTAAPCNARLGGVTYSFTAPASVNVSSGTGTLYIYVSSNGALTAGNNIGATCASGCIAASGVTAFPPDAIPLSSWTVTNGTLDLTGGTDFRALLSAKDIVAGTGVISTLSGGTSILSVDTTVIPSFSGANVFTGSDDFTSAGSTAPNKTGTAASLPSSCTVGQTYFETNAAAGQNLFGCTGTNTWTQLSGGSGGGGSTTTETREYPTVACSGGGGAYIDTGWSEAATAGVGASCSGANSNIGYFYFFPAAGATSAVLHTNVPYGWSGGEVDFILYITPGAATTDTFSIQTSCVAAGGAFDIPTYNTAQTLNTNGTSTAEILNLSNLTTTGCAALDELVISITRTDSNSHYDYVYSAVLKVVRNL